MLHFRSRRALSVVALALFTTAASPAVRRSPGITFDMETVTTAQSMMPGTGGSVKVMTKGMVNTKGAMRMEVVSMEGPTSPYAIGDYFLTMDGKMLLIHPATKTYADMAELAATTMTNLPPQVMAQMTISGITGNTEKLTDVLTIEGRPTEHYRTTVGYSMNMMGQVLPTTVVNDYWAAKLPIKFVNPLMGSTKSPITTGPMVELVAKQIELMPKITDAIVVKSSSTSTVSVMGQSIVTTILAEMKNIKEGDVDDSKFVLPEGYTKAAK
jgi:hypothetical protein